MSSQDKAASSRPPPNIVHQNAIHAETVKKEMRNQQIRTTFTFNPQKKQEVFADKPNNITPSVFKKNSTDKEVELLKATRKPKEKYPLPLTSSQEYGWDIEDEDLKQRSDVMHKPKESCEITRFMSEYWKHQSQQREQTGNAQNVKK
eukprot:m.63625 g.63625  ORF g.63625 m.63625 type:complete len:147 (-) comp11450_c0_seq1:1644-2084(-)